MGRQLSFCASLDDWMEIFKFLKNNNLCLYLECRHEDENGVTLFTYYENFDPKAMTQKRLDAFIVKKEWNRIHSRKSGFINVYDSEIIQLQQFGDIGLLAFGVLGFRLYVTMNAVEGNAFVKKSEDFRKSYDQLTAFIKKYGMIDVGKRDYILPDAYRIYSEHPEEVKGAYTSFLPQKIKAWPK